MERVSNIALDILNELHTEHLAYQSEYLPLVECVNTCSEYEDTGLTPDEIKQIKAENTALKARLDKAVELPCKVGDVVWLLDLNIYHRCEARVIPCIIDEFTTVRNGTHAVLNGRGAYLTWRRFRAVHINDFGKTVFLTEAEARSKLDELKGGAE